MKPGRKASMSTSHWGATTLRDAALTRAKRTRKVGAMAREVARARNRKSVPRRFSSQILARLLPQMKEPRESSLGSFGGSGETVGVQHHFVARSARSPHTSAPCTPICTPQGAATLHPLRQQSVRNSRPCHFPGERGRVPVQIGRCAFGHSVHELGCCSQDDDEFFGQFLRDVWALSPSAPS